MDTHRWVVILIVIMMRLSKRQFQTYLHLNVLKGSIGLFCTQTKTTATWCQSFSYMTSVRTAIFIVRLVAEPMTPVILSLPWLMQAGHSPIIRHIKVRTWQFEKYILQQLNYSMTLSQLFDVRNKVPWSYPCKYIQMFKQMNILNAFVFKCKLLITMEISCMQMIMPSF